MVLRKLNEHVFAIFATRRPIRIFNTAVAISNHIKSPIRWVDIKNDLSEKAQLDYRLLKAPIGGDRAYAS